MRHGFTLIELMIVIAIIAIIAAIAIPNLLESRISSNEAAAAASLKSGVFPAEVQFQAGSYVDIGSLTSVATPNGIGDFSYLYSAMSGASNGTGLPATGVALALLPSTWNVANPIIGGYQYTLGSGFETGFCAACYPSDSGASIGRRCFAINAGGTVYATAPASTNALTKIGSSGTITASTSTTAVNADIPFGGGFSVVNTNWTVYKR